MLFEAQGVFEVEPCSGTRVLLVRDRFQPVCGAVGAQRRAYGYVDHEGVGSRAVPVPLAGGKEDDISGFDLLDGPALRTRASGAGDDEEKLSLRVGVPVRARPRLEEHPE
jgi:hypothetical protein